MKPPLLDKNDPRHPVNDSLYKDVEENLLPSGENLRNTMKRVIEYWNAFILLELKNKKSIIIVAHGNSLRALIKYLSNISNEEIMKIETGSPICYEFDEELKPIKYYYLKTNQSIEKK